MTDTATLLRPLIEGLAHDRIIPYFGPGMLDLIAHGSPVPATPEALAELMTAKVTVPHKIRKRLTSAAQFIENFKHRKTLTSLMNAAFEPSVTPSALHNYFASLPTLSLLVAAWYDDAPQNAFAARSNWGLVQGLSQAEHFGQWTAYFHANGSPATEAEAETWSSLLYQPIGCVRPAANYLVSDSDYVEVLTEIDIQTPIPARVQSLRAGRHFLFLGCRFNDQLQRTFARQIMKRSSDQHWAVLSCEPTRNELRFLTEQNIQPIYMPLAEFAAILTQEQLVDAA